MVIKTIGLPFVKNGAHRGEYSHKLGENNRTATVYVWFDSALLRNSMTSLIYGLKVSLQDARFVNEKLISDTIFTFKRLSCII